MENSKRGKSASKHPLQSYKIHSIRTKLANHPTILVQFEELLSFYASLKDSQSQHIADSQQQLNVIINNLKTSVQQPYKWFQGLEAREDGEKGRTVLFQGKVHHFDEIYSIIAANSLFIDALNQIQTNQRTDSDVKNLPIGESKLALIDYYQEINDYYHHRACISRLKGKMNIEEILRSNPFIQKCKAIQGEIQEIRKQEESIDKVNRSFIEIQEQLLGFKLTGEKAKNLCDIQARLQKLLSFVKDSKPTKDTEKSTPKNVKECNLIIQLLSLLGNSNVFLMQEKVKELDNRRIKEAFITIMQNIIKKERITEDIYNLLLLNINERVRILYSRTVKHLSLEKKLGECEKLIRELRKSTSLPLQNPQLSQRHSHANADAINHDKTMRQELEAMRLESDQRLLNAEEEIYSLQMNSESLRRINQEIKANLQQKERLFEAEKNTLCAQVLKLQGQNEQARAKNAVLQDKVTHYQANQQIINSKLQQKQQQIKQTTANIQQLVNHLNTLARIHQTRIHISTQTFTSTCLSSKLNEHTISPIASIIKNMGEDFNFIEDVPLNLCNSHITGQASPTQSPTNSPSTRKRMMKHARSLSNVDFYSELMPESIEKEYLDNILEGTCQSQELKKGIQIRERTIKKYQAFMEKQRQEAKRHRSQILELQSKIRGLQIQQIRLKQLIEDQSSEKQLHYIQEEEECGSMISISDSCEKIQEIGSIEKIAEKEVELKVKQQRINFKIEQIIQHVLKLNTFKAIPDSPYSACYDDEYMSSAEFTPQGKRMHETQ